MRFQIYSSASYRPNMFTLLVNPRLTANLTDSEVPGSSHLVHDHQEPAARNPVHNLNQ